MGFPRQLFDELHALQASEGLIAREKAQAVCFGQDIPDAIRGADIQMAVGEPKPHRSSHDPLSDFELRKLERFDHGLGLGAPNLANQPVIELAVVEDADIDALQV